MSVEDETPKESAEGVISRLSKLSDIEYEKVRKIEAKKLGFRPSGLDKAVKEARPELLDDESKAGREVVFSDCKMCKSPVSGFNVLDEAYSHVKRHMHISDTDAVKSVLWAVHTHMYHKFNHTPRLVVTAPEPECGKTVLLFHMIGNLSNRILATDNLSPAVYFRLAEKHECTFLIDEGDIFLNQDSDLIAGFNNGFEPHGGVYRCHGDEHEVRLFPTFAPLALAGIRLEKKLPPATVSRAHVICLERVFDEIADSDSWDKDIHRQGLINTRGKIARWIHDNVDKIAQCRPSLPRGIRNRTKDKWLPLFSIAQVAGGSWPEKVLTAYNHSINAHEPTKSEQFLIDVKSVFPEEGHMHTDTLIEKLCEMEDSKYLEYNFKQFDPEKKKIQSRQISNLLAKYEFNGRKIKPSNIRIFDSQKKGYNGDQLRKIFERYIPKIPVQLDENFSTSSDTGILSVPPSHCPPDMGFKQNLPVQCNNGRTDRKPLKPATQQQWDGGTDKTHGNGNVVKKTEIIQPDPDEDSQPDPDKINTVLI